MSNMDASLAYKKMMVHRYLILLLYAAVCILIYWKALDGPFILDDLNSFAPILNLDSNLRTVLLNLERYIIELDRPVAYLTFIINAVFNGENIFYWKLTNLVLHIICGFLLFVFCRLLLKKRDNAVLLSAFIAGIWLIHPLQVSTVLYVVQRMTILSSLFVLLGLICYLKGRRLQQAGRHGSVYILLAFLVFMPLGTLAKENALLFPAFALLLEVFKFHFKSGAENRNDQYLLLLFVFILISALIMILVGLNNNLLSGYEIRDFTLLERLMTQSRVMFIYLLQIFIPIKQNLGFMHDDIVISSGLFNPVTTLFSIISLILLLFIAWMVRVKDNLISLGIFIYFAGHLMESTIIPLEMMYEHRNYLPSAGIIISLVIIISKCPSRLVFISIMTTISIMLAVLAYKVTSSWTSMPVLFEYMYSVHPKSSRLQNVKAGLLAREGKYFEAYRLLDETDDQRFALKKLTIKCMEEGKLDDSLIESATSQINRPIHSDYVSTLADLTNLGISDKCEYNNDKVIDLIDRALEYRVINNFEKHRIIVYRAYHYWNQDKYPEALSNLERAYEYYPNDPVPLLLAVNLSYRTGQKERAFEYLERVEKIPDPFVINFEQDILTFKKLLKNYIRNGVINE